MNSININNNRKTRRGTRGRGRRVRNNANKFQQNGTTIVPASLMGSFPFPVSLKTQLCFQKNFVLQGAADHVVHDLMLNSLHTFDFTGGTTDEFSGSAALALIYNLYHVERVNFSFTAVGNETGQGVWFGIILKDAQPSVQLTSYALVQNALEVAPTTGPIVVGETTGMAIYRSRNYDISLGNVLGNTASYMADTTYTAVFGNDPAQRLWMGLLAYSAIPTTDIPNGVIVSLRVELTVRAYSILDTVT